VPKQTQGFCQYFNRKIQMDYADASLYSSTLGKLGEPRLSTGEFNRLQEGIVARSCSKVLRTQMHFPALRGREAQQRICEMRLIRLNLRCNFARYVGCGRPRFPAVFLP
jgi:hypothetical protein